MVTIKGPTINPNNPKLFNPPSTPKNISMVWSFVLLLMKIGRKKLSERPTTAPPQARRIIPFKYDPWKKK
jgi:hypothetical protein